MSQAIEKSIVLVEGLYDKSDLAKLRTKPIWRTVDIFQRQTEDLFEVTNPGLTKSATYEDEKSAYTKTRAGSDPELAGDWVYYPWSGVLVHCIGSLDQAKLRTNRNQNIITQDEQNKMAEARVAVAGMSVGAGIAVSLAYSSGGMAFNLADFDLLETPNLNRVQAGIEDVGLPKTVIAARRIWTVDPYARLSLFPDGISGNNLNDFLGGDQPVDVVFDEIDDFQMKIHLRRAARRLGIPVVMMTGLGDSILIDIERYDLQPNLEIFNGLIGGLEVSILDGEVSEQDAKRYAAQIVGIENVPTRAIESLLEIGKTLVGRPQLGSTVTIEGGLATFVVRKLLLGAPVTSGRYRIELGQIFGLEEDAMDRPERQVSLRKLFK